MKIINKDTRQMVDRGLLNAIAPAFIKINDESVIFGENHLQTSIISAYPSNVSASWLSKLSNLSGVVVRVNAKSLDSMLMLNRLNRAVEELEARVISDKGKASYKHKTIKELNDAHALIHRISENSESVYDVLVAITVFGKTKEALAEKMKEVKTVMAEMSMNVVNVPGLQEDLLKTTFPSFNISKDVKAIGHRNMPAVTLAASYPFNVSGHNDESGWIFGQDNFGSLVVLDPWKRSGDRANSNWAIFGASGKGKSTAIKKMLYSEWQRGTKIIILDPEAEYIKLCKALDGKYISAGGGEGGIINPLQVRAVKKLSEKEIAELDLETKNEIEAEQNAGALSVHVRSLKNFFKMVIKDLNDYEMAVLVDVLEKLYVDFGITNHSDFANLKNTDYPILEDLYNYFIKNAAEQNDRVADVYDKLAMYLKEVSVGLSRDLWSGHTQVNADNDFVVIDLKRVSESTGGGGAVQRAQYYNVLSWAWDQLTTDKTERCMLVVDEAHVLIDPQVTETMQFLKSLVKRARKYKVGLAVISQSLADFLAPEVRFFGQALIDNANTKLFMGSDGKGLDDIKEVMKLTKTEEDLLLKGNIGNGLFIVGSSRMHLIVKVTEEELAVFDGG